MATEYRAELKNCGVSAQKARLVVDLIRGKKAVDSLNQLQYMTQTAASHVHRLLKSAVANAEENFGANRDELMVHTIYADEAPTRKWRRFGARGRFKPLLRRNSHIVVILRERE